MASPARILRKLASFAVTRGDLAFTLGRVFGLVPAMLLSHLLTDEAVLAERLAAFQVALFVSTIVLYGGPQTYLVKLGVERKVFIFHMAISSVIIAVALAGAQAAGWATGLLLPFIFLVFFRSYYLLLASYLKFDVRASLWLIGAAVLALVAYAATLSDLAGAAVAAPLIGLILYRLGYLKWAWARLAVRRYFRILRENFAYFYNFLLQQTNSQIVLAVYVLIAQGPDYIRAAHGVYLYSVSFILHGILFRLTLANMGRERSGQGIRQQFIANIRLSLAVGMVAAVLVVLFYPAIERLFFGGVYLDRTAAIMVAAMIVLNSSNFGWAALMTRARQPYLLAAVGTLSTGFVIAGLFLQDWLAIPDGIFWVMIAGLLIQAAGRNILGMALLRNLDD